MITTLAISVAWIVYSMIPPLLLLWYTFIGRGTTLKLLCRRGPAAARLLHGQACSMGRCADQNCAIAYLYASATGCRAPRWRALQQLSNGQIAIVPAAPASRVNMTRGIVLTAQER